MELDFNVLFQRAPSPPSLPAFSHSFFTQCFAGDLGHQNVGRERERNSEVEVDLGKEEQTGSEWFFREEKPDVCAQLHTRISVKERERDWNLMFSPFFLWGCRNGWPITLPKDGFSFLGVGNEMK